jgi:hypothetical protein
VVKADWAFADASALTPFSITRAIAHVAPLPAQQPPAEQRAEQSH